MRLKLFLINYLLDFLFNLITTTEPLMISCTALLSSLILTATRENHPSNILTTRWMKAEKNDTFLSI